MPQQKGDVGSLPALLDQKYVRTVEVGATGVGVYYPGEVEIGRKSDGGDRRDPIRIVGHPPSGWEMDLTDSIQELRKSSGDIRDVLGYLPQGTLVEYESDQKEIPTEIGIADELRGRYLNQVVTIIELWLKKKLE